MTTASITCKWYAEIWVLNFNLRAQISTLAALLCEVFVVAVAIVRIVVVRKREGGREKPPIPLPGFQDPYNPSPSYLFKHEPH